MSDEIKIAGYKELGGLLIDPDPPCDRCGDVCCGCYTEEVEEHGDGIALYSIAHPPGALERLVSWIARRPIGVENDER